MKIKKIIGWILIFIFCVGIYESITWTDKGPQGMFQAQMKKRKINHNNMN